MSAAINRTLLALWQDRSRKSIDVKKLARQYMGVVREARKA